jgi:uncharacterized membrane protein YdbT with pleckstrin-like domain
VKACPFCAEQIQDAATKCRFCNSMLDGSASAGGPPQQGASRALAPAVVIFEGSPSWKAWFWSYVLLTIPTVFIAWAVLNTRRKSLRYRISNRTIDYEVGVFSKRVETMPLWRVLDIEFQQSFMDRILGIATINLVTKDPTTPRLSMRGLPASREIFDRLKDACEAARQSRVVEVV